MRLVHVNLGQRSYDIIISSGLLHGLPGCFEKYEINRRLFIISNPKVFRLYGEELTAVLGASGYQTTEILIPDGEKYKTLQTLENIYTYLIAQGADRQSAIIALGGGVTGDMAGFAAATFHRGIPYLQIPTTLLSQVDSSVGGKTGVNHSLGKNLIGAFYQPHLVCIDVSTLETLPEREFQSGLYEVLKYGLIYDADFFTFFEENLDRIKQRVPGVIESVVSRCCEIKAEVTSIDESEANLRRILNFGHTLGHAIENASAYSRLTHGEAVGYGMIGALELSQLRGYLDQRTVDRITRCILSVGPLPSIDDLEADDVMQAMARDKKRQHDKVHFVLLTRIGETSVESDIGEESLTGIWKHLLSIGGQGA